MVRTTEGAPSTHACAPTRTLTTHSLLHRREAELLVVVGLGGLLVNERLVVSLGVDVTEVDLDPHERVGLSAGGGEALQRLRWLSASKASVLYKIGRAGGAQ